MYFNMTDHERQLLTPILWNPETEVCLFYAMRGYKPVGINKHFQMMGIHNKFSAALGHTVTSNQLWDHLSTMYNLAVLDDSEGLPFDNSVKDFQLPEEIINYKKNINNSPDHGSSGTIKSSPSSTEAQSQGKNSSGSKSSRKRTRNVVSSSPITNTPPINKRRRQ